MEGFEVRVAVAEVSTEGGGRYESEGGFADAACEQEGREKEGKVRKWTEKMIEKLRFWLARSSDGLRIVSELPFARNDLP